MGKGAKWAMQLVMTENMKIRKSDFTTSFNILPIVNSSDEKPSVGATVSNASPMIPCTTVVFPALSTPATSIDISL